LGSIDSYFFPPSWSDRTVNSGVVESAATNPLRFEGTEIRVPSASVVLATGGGGATYDDQTRIVYTKVRPVLKTADFLAAAPVAFMGLRLLDGNYAGPLIKVRRVDTGATLDIYPTSTGALDAAAIATHCGSAVGTIAVIYDQSGAGRNATTAVTTREYRIWSGTAITTIGSCGKPFAFIDAEDRGYTFSIPTLTRTALSAVLVGSLGNGVVNSTPGGRFMSQLDSSSTNTDGAAPTRAILIGRAGGTTPSSSWQVYRNNAQLVAAAIAYDTVEQISTIFYGTNVSLQRNNWSPIQSGLLGCLQRHAHRPGLRGQQHVPLAARVLRRRVMVFLHRPQRSGSRRAVCRRKGLLRPAIVAIAS